MWGGVEDPLLVKISTPSQEKCTKPPPDPSGMDIPVPFLSLAKIVNAKQHHVSKNLEGLILDFQYTFYENFCLRRIHNLLS